MTNHRKFNSRKGKRKRNNKDVKRQIEGNDDCCDHCIVHVSDHMWNKVYFVSQ